MHDVLERMGGRTVDVVEEAEIDTVLERPDDVVVEARRDTGEAAMKLMAPERTAADALRACIPAGYGLKILGGADGVSAEVTVHDRAPIRSVGGDKTLRLDWDGLDGTVTLDGKAVPLSQLAAALDAYDRSVNWSAIQGMRF